MTFIYDRLKSLPLTLSIKKYFNAKKIISKKLEKHHNHGKILIINDIDNKCLKLW